jgi:hypothetical protein
MALEDHSRTKLVGVRLARGDTGDPTVATRFGVLTHRPFFMR